MLSSSGSGGLLFASGCAVADFSARGPNRHFFLARLVGLLDIGGSISSHRAGGVSLRRSISLRRLSISSGSVVAGCGWRFQGRRGPNKHFCFLLLLCGGALFCAVPELIWISAKGTLVEGEGASLGMMFSPVEVGCGMFLVGFSWIFVCPARNSVCESEWAGVCS